MDEDEGSKKPATDKCQFVLVEQGDPVPVGDCIDSFHMCPPAEVEVASRVSLGDL